MLNDMDSDRIEGKNQIENQDNEMKKIDLFQYKDD